MNLNYTNLNKLKTDEIMENILKAKLIEPEKVFQPFKIELEINSHKQLLHIIDVLEDLLNDEGCDAFEQLHAILETQRGISV